MVITKIPVAVSFHLNVSLSNFTVLFLVFHDHFFILPLLFFGNALSRRNPVYSSALNLVFHDASICHLTLRKTVIFVSSNIYDCFANANTMYLKKKVFLALWALLLSLGGVHIKHFLGDFLQSPKRQSIFYPKLACEHPQASNHRVCAASCMPVACMFTLCYSFLPWLLQLTPHFFFASDVTLPQGHCLYLRIVLFCGQVFSCYWFFICYWFFSDTGWMHRKR